MTSPDTTLLRQRLVRVVTQRAGSSTNTDAVAAAARRAHEELRAVLSPLISSAGVEALSGRAFDLAQREYPAEQRRTDTRPADEPVGQVRLWLERQPPETAARAAAAMFAIFAELLTALIGEPLTMRYLQKAWPEAFPDAEPKGRKA